MIRKIAYNVRLRVFPLEVASLTKLQVQSTADQAKQSDTKNIKHNIALLVPLEYLPLSNDGKAAVNMYQHVDVQSPGSTKSWRGWGNPITSRLLCPVEYIAQFKADPDGYVNIS